MTFLFIASTIGKTHLREVLLIHATEDQKGSRAVAWTNLPRLHVSVTGKGSVTDIIQESIVNIFHFTVETLHNITPDFNENVQVATVLPQTQVTTLYYMFLTKLHILTVQLLK